MDNDPAVNAAQLDAAAIDKVCLAPGNNIVKSRAVDPDPAVNAAQLEAAAMDKVCLASSNNIVKSRAVDPNPDPIRIRRSTLLSWRQQPWTRFVFGPKQ